ncbi:competence type IV pilus minor pilin ComGD [Rummeliibacillus pycnus]|uniref:competence type IV pilus minor pilin ComGD n=1 Tax=Rummeliibacillus pycnus TaxID=101070 RepID=UPI0014744F85|nr:competence type IV pilus minor pilin ComGD [Rummeliibacillus pycnus]
MSRTKYIRDEKGFTFIEMLVVLVITMLICSIGISVGKKQLDRELENRFVEQLKADIELAQALSYRYQDAVSLYVMDSMGEIQIFVPKISKVQPIIVRKYPETISFQFYSTLDHVIFTERQTVSRAGTMTFKINGRKVELIVYLGEGRVKFVQ